MMDEFFLKYGFNPHKAMEGVGFEKILTLSVDDDLHSVLFWSFIMGYDGNFDIETMIE